MNISEKEKLKRFIILRNYYIDLLESKSITKSEFNHKNNEIFSKLNLRPFSVLDTFEKALYNYNYYNSKAKMCQEEYLRYRNQKNEKKAKIAENNKKNNYFHKDQAIISMINIENSSSIEAYFINMHSKKLKEEIFEIYFCNRERTILHTKNTYIKNILCKKNCFLKEKKDSLISNYINN